MLPLLELRDQPEATRKRTCTWRTMPGRRAGRPERTSRYTLGPTRADSSTTPRSDRRVSRPSSFPEDDCTYMLQHSYNN